MTKINLLSLHLFLTISTAQAALSQPPLIMIDPAGHAKDPGRRLHQNYERAQTFQCAQALKAALEQQSNSRVLLTRSPGDEIVPLQNASFANRMDAQLLVRLSFYKEEAEKPKLYLYNLVYDPVIDFAQRTRDPLSFIPVHQAHYKNIQTTTNYGQKMHQLLTLGGYQKQFDCMPIKGLPIKGLVGIQAPAILIEIGLTDDTQWNLFIEPISKAIAAVLS